MLGENPAPVTEEDCLKHIQYKGRILGCEMELERYRYKLLRLRLDSYRKELGDIRQDLSAKLEKSKSSIIDLLSFKQLFYYGAEREQWLQVEIAKLERKIRKYQL